MSARFRDPQGIPREVRAAAGRALRDHRGAGVTLRAGECIVTGASDDVAGELLGLGFVADLHVRGEFRWAAGDIAGAFDAAS